MRAVVFILLLLATAGVAEISKSRKARHKQLQSVLHDRDTTVRSPDASSENSPDYLQQHKTKASHASLSDQAESSQFLELGSRGSSQADEESEDDASDDDSAPDRTASTTKSTVASNARVVASDNSEKATTKLTATTATRSAKVTTADRTSVQPVRATTKNEDPDDSKKEKTATKADRKEDTDDDDSDESSNEPKRVAKTESSDASSKEDRSESKKAEVKSDESSDDQPAKDDSDSSDKQKESSDKDKDKSDEDDDKNDDDEKDSKDKAAAGKADADAKDKARESPKDTKDAKESKTVKKLDAKVTLKRKEKKDSDDDKSSTGRAQPASRVKAVPRRPAIEGADSGQDDDDADEDEGMTDMPTPTPVSPPEPEKAEKPKEEAKEDKDDEEEKDDDKEAEESRPATPPPAAQPAASSSTGVAGDSDDDESEDKEEGEEPGKPEAAPRVAEEEDSEQDEEDQEKAELAAEQGGPFPVTNRTTANRRPGCYLWTETANSRLAGGPDSRRGHASWVDERSNSLLVFGGCSSLLAAATPSCTSDLYEWDLAKKEWHAHQVSAPKMAGAASAYNPESWRMYHFGGLRADANQPAYTPSNSLDYLVHERILTDDASGSAKTQMVWAWHHVNTHGDAPPASAYGSLTLIPTENGVHLLSFGGQSGENYLSSVYTIRVSAPRSDNVPHNATASARASHELHRWVSWTPRGPGPRGRRGHTATFVPGDDANAVFVFGGEDKSRAYDQLWVLTMPVDEAEDWDWTVVAQVHKDVETMPAARAFHSAVLLGSRLLIFGGCNLRGTEPRCYGDLHIFDTDPNRWVAIPTGLGEGLSKIAGPSPRMGHSAVLHGKMQPNELDPSPTDSVEMVVFGGSSLNQCTDDWTSMDLNAVCKESCGAHGSFQQETGKCKCDPRYAGRFCAELAKCADQCSGPTHGICEVHDTASMCICQGTWFGQTCGLGLCTNNCTGHGICSPSKGGTTCQCLNHFEGADCSSYVTEEAFLQTESGSDRDAEDSDENEDGSFLELRSQRRGGLGLGVRAATGGKAVASAGPEDGETLAQVFGEGCPSHCSGHGICVRITAGQKGSRCECLSGFGGPDCSRQCPNQCTGPRQGICTADGTCKCFEGYRGPDCSQRYCAHNCSGHGLCENGECYCNRGYVGGYCEIDSSCSHHGQLVDDTCRCEDGFGKADCSQVLPCDGLCSPHGRCVEKNSPSHRLALLAYLKSGSHVFPFTTKSQEFDQGRATGDGICICDPQWGGDHCGQRLCLSNCNGHGSCSQDGTCHCYPGYTLDDCSQIIPCPHNCTSASHGICQRNGECQCRTGWRGKDCALLGCPNDCNGNGDCIEGQCRCARGFSGRDCSQACPHRCSGHGECFDGKCLCEPGFQGEDCGEVTKCPMDKVNQKECSAKGICFRPSGICYCQPGYTGPDCSQDNGACGEKHCSGHGTCLHGKCWCDFGYEGDQCEKTPKCENDCYGHGFCLRDECHCYTGFEGKYCEKFTTDKTCPQNCNKRGVCQFGKCFCMEGYSGDDCGVVTGFCKDNDCSGHGICEYGKCHCEPSWGGPKCQLGGCQSGCHPQHGRCLLGTCHCLPGWSGADCTEEMKCPSANRLKCSGHGVCVLGTCACLPGYAGEDCATLTLDGPPCVNNCTDNGVCMLGRCFCVPGRAGKDCEMVIQEDCPLSCAPVNEEGHREVRGICRFGKCFCHPGYFGDGCEHEKECSERCALNGVCGHGKCFCVPGFTGPDCDVRIDEQERLKVLEADMKVDLKRRPSDGCGNGCNFRGVCVNDKCACETGFYGSFCEEVVGVLNHRCPENCHGRGQCLFGQCYCRPGYTGRGCEMKVSMACPADCHSRGFCYFGQCYCDPGWKGKDCGQEDTCGEGCGLHGLCIGGKCRCTPFYSGEACNVMAQSREAPVEDEMQIMAFREKLRQTSHKRKGTNSDSTHDAKHAQKNARTSHDSPAAEADNSKAQPVAALEQTAKVGAAAVAGASAATNNAASSQGGAQTLERPDCDDVITPGWSVSLIVVGSLIAGAVVTSVIRLIVDRRAEKRKQERILQTMLS